MCSASSLPSPAVLSVHSKLKFGKLREILLLVTVHCSDLFVLRKSSDRGGIYDCSAQCVGAPAISPAILNTCLLKVPCTQRMKLLICDPLTARRALSIPWLRLPESKDTSNRRQGYGCAFGTCNYAIMNRLTQTHTHIFAGTGHLHWSLFFFCCHKEPVRC